MCIIATPICNTEETVQPCKDQSNHATTHLSLGLDGVVPLRKVHLLLSLPLSLLVLLLGRHPSPDGTGLLRSQVKREVLLLLVEKT